MENITIRHLMLALRTIGLLSLLNSIVLLTWSVTLKSQIVTV